MAILVLLKAFHVLWHYFMAVVIAVTAFGNFLLTQWNGAILLTCGAAYVFCGIKWEESQKKRLTVWQHSLFWILTIVAGLVARQM